MKYIDELKEVIQKLHGSDAVHIETVPVKEVFQGETVWEGEVEVFDLADHPKTSRVFAWAHDTDDADSPRRVVTVLQIPPATTPENAVRASIVSDYKEQANAES
jgi:DNA gyrase inhibitor GyrI